MDLTKLDIERFLNANDVVWLKVHPNITRHCVGTCCPFCEDDSFHLGIFKSGKNFSCWKCGTTGSLFDLMSALIGMSWSAFVAEVNRHSEQVLVSDGVKAIRDLINGRALVAEEERLTYDTLPPKCLSVSSPLAQEEFLFCKFMKDRNIPLDSFIERGCVLGMMGELAHRLIFPIYENKKMVGYQGRALRDDLKPKYLFPDHFHTTEYLYNADSGLLNGRLILVEGAFDTWRMGDGTWATFSAHMSSQQRVKIMKAAPQQLVFAWDSDAYNYALKEARYWVPFVPEVKVLRLPEGHDPDSLGSETVYQLMESTEPLS
jgi:hypothetical protein